MQREQPAQPRLLVGASIGAWRFYAASQMDANAALERLGEAYITQTYPPKPSADTVSQTCAGIVASIRQGTPAARNSNYQLAVVTSRARGALLKRATRSAFARAALRNALSRSQLATVLERVVFVEGTSGFTPFDSFGLKEVPLNELNWHQALLASGTIPLLAAPVIDPPLAEKGWYWDGGLIDYHVHWPWQHLDGVVLYPHFVDHVIPGWLDKAMPWRRARGVATDPLIVLSPSPRFLATLPGGRLPERQDFYRFGQNHQARFAAWRQALEQCQQLADAFLQFADDPAAFRIDDFPS